MSAVRDCVRKVASVARNRILGPGYAALDRRWLSRASAAQARRLELFARLSAVGVPRAVAFDFTAERERALAYLGRMREGGPASLGYRFAGSCRTPNLYTAAYACMTLSLLGVADELPPGTRRAWANHFDSFQSAEDGLFYDPRIDGDAFRGGDSWGAGHLALHVIVAYEGLGAAPPHPFRFLERYYDDGEDSWCRGRGGELLGTPDEAVDNRVMNVGCLAQYARDRQGDRRAGAWLAGLKERLAKRAEPGTGLWGRVPPGDRAAASRAAQFAYHLLALQLYDGDPLDRLEEKIDLVLETQSEIGGYGAPLNSSACEDIDSVFLLVKLAERSPYRREEIRTSLKRALPWILSNANPDGGFVFRQGEAFSYGHPEMTAGPDESSLFATWFRTLSLAYLVRHLGLPNGYVIRRVPGLEF